jgi:hypothetical protein
VVAVVALKDLPLGLNIVAAALLGMTAGLLIRGPATAVPAPPIAAPAPSSTPAPIRPQDSADST